MKGATRCPASPARIRWKTRRLRQSAPGCSPASMWRDAAIAQGLRQARWPGRLQRIAWHWPGRWLGALGRWRPQRGGSDRARPRGRRLGRPAARSCGRHAEHEAAQGLSAASRDPSCAGWRRCRFPVRPRARRPSDIQAAASALGISCETDADVGEAITRLSAGAAQPGRILVCGSLHLVGDVLAAAGVPAA